MRFSAFGGAVENVMKQRVHSGLANLGITSQIKNGVEERMRPEVSVIAVVQIIRQGICTWRLLALAQIEVRVEQRVRIATFKRARRYEVPERILARGRYVGIRFAIVIGVEQKSERTCGAHEPWIRHKPQPADDPGQEARRRSLASDPLDFSLVRVRRLGNQLVRVSSARLKPGNGFFQPP